LNSRPSPLSAAPAASRKRWTGILWIVGLAVVAAGAAQLAGVFVAGKVAEPPAGSDGAGLAAAGAVAGAAAAAAPKPQPAALSVTATDGDDLQVWLQRAGEEPRRIEPESADLPPGRVTLQVLRQRAGGAPRADLVSLTLHAGRSHLVAVGDRPLRARTRVEGRDLELAARFLPPGVAGVDDHEWRLVVSDPAAEAAGAGAHAGPSAVTTAGPNASPAPGPRLSLTFGPPRSEAEDLWLSAKDQILLIVNPYADPIACTVAAGGWQQEIVIDGPACRFVPIGGAAAVTVSSRLASGGEPFEERTLQIQPGLPLHTIGGATVYRWLGQQEGACPPAPDGALAHFSAETRVRLPAEGDPAHWILISQLRDLTTGLAVVVSDPPEIPAAPQALTVQAGVRVVELAAPAALRGRTIQSVATDGSRLIAIAGGTAHDFATGEALHAPAPVEIARAAAGPAGLVLLTRTGTLATLRDGQLLTGEPLYDPTWRLAAAAESVPAVWLYDGGAQTDLILRPLDGTDSLQHLNWPGLTALRASGAGTLLAATGRRLERARLSEGFVSTEAILILPEESPPIVSILELNGRLLFSTSGAVYALQGNLVLPLAEGIGGELHPWRDGLLVHDARTLRLYQLTGAALAVPAAAPIAAEDEQ